MSMRFERVSLRSTVCTETLLRRIAFGKARRPALVTPPRHPRHHVSRPRPAPFLGRAWIAAAKRRLSRGSTTGAAAGRAHQEPLGMSDQLLPPSDVTIDRRAQRSSMMALHSAIRAFSASSPAPRGQDRTPVEAECKQVLAVVVSHKVPGERRLRMRGRALLSWRRRAPESVEHGEEDKTRVTDVANARTRGRASHQRNSLAWALCSGAVRQPDAPGEEGC